MREYFKKGKIVRSKLYKFVKLNGADYIEDEKAVWIKPEKSKNTIHRAAIMMEKNGAISMGRVDESCLNFVPSAENNSQETQEWIIGILKKTITYKK